MTDAATALTDEVYRNKLADWMIAHDIPTGTEAETFDELLEAIAAHIKAMEE
jgi:hypothetical protein